MISYGELLEESDKCLIFLKKISLKDKALRGRFGKYKKLVKIVWDNIQNGNKKNVLDFINKEGFRTGDLVFFALKELTEMVQIIEQIEKLYNNTTEAQKTIITQKIDSILGGTVYTKNENAKNNKARNYQFELLIAAKLYAAGIINIELEKTSDIVVTVGSLKYAIECKRIFGKFEDKVIKRAEEALDQILLIRNDIFCGAIAFDFSTKYEQGKNIVTGTTKESIGDYVQNCLKEDLNYVYKNSQKIVKKAKRGFLIGMFGNISSTYVLKDKSEMGHLSQVALLSLNKENPTKSKNFLKDFDKLSKNG